MDISAVSSNVSSRPVARASSGNKERDEGHVSTNYSQRDVQVESTRNRRDQAQIQDHAELVKQQKQGLEAHRRRQKQQLARETSYAQNTSHKQQETRASFNREKLQNSYKAVQNMPQTFSAAKASNDQTDRVDANQVTRQASAIDLIV